MDQLTAYEILGLNQGASQEEIKEAYAALCKKYHPEEAPEEFQRINEAYRTLAPRGRRSNSHRVVQGQDVVKSSFVKPEEPQESTYDFDSIRMEKKERVEKENLNFNNIRIERKENESESFTYNFDEAIYRAEQENTQTLLKQAVDEIKGLLFTSYKEKVKLFERFFKKEEYQSILRSSLFTENLAELLAQAKVKQAVYACIARYYRLENANPAMVDTEL